jgi:hypothetical protein
MDQPHHMFLGGEEECHSSESGWTMYIGSPIKDGNFYDDDDDEVDFYQGINQITQGMLELKVMMILWFLMLLLDQVIMVLMLFNLWEIMKKAMV